MLVLTNFKFCADSTGFEEDKNFHVVLNSVIAGRYHVTEYLGSAAFSKAIQAHDLHTGMDVCVKVIKNNKDFFDQSLDEIKLLKYVNKHDPADKHHILRLYDYFYYRETNRLECLIPKKTSLRHRLPMGDQGFIDFVAHLLEVNPKNRPSASEALKHPWLSYPYEPISA
ncbi:hypothetical protein V6N13_010220 [Hibiscus sabdariffa]